MIRSLMSVTGGTNYKGQILFAAEGQGANVPSELIIMNPVEPYNTTGEHVPKVHCVQKPKSTLIHESHN